MDALADERGAPSKQDIASGVTANSMAKEWNDFELYVQHIVSHDPHAYVPLVYHTKLNYD